MRPVLVPLEVIDVSRRGRGGRTQLKRMEFSLSAQNRPSAKR
jgi:hypothetical protein